MSIIRKLIREVISDIELDKNDIKLVPDEELIRRYDLMLTKKRKQKLSPELSKYLELLRNEILFVRKLDLTKY